MLCSASLFLSLRYVSTSLLWGQGVAGTTVATLSSAWRSHWQCTGRHMEGLRQGHHTAMRCTRRPWRLCGSVSGGVHSCLQGVHRPSTTIRDNSVGAPGRSYLSGVGFLREARERCLSTGHYLLQLFDFIEMASWLS